MRFCYVTKTTTVLSSIDGVINEILRELPDIFTFNRIDEGIVSIRDFQTTGVVAFAKGAPFYNLTPGSKTIQGQRVVIKKEYLDNCIEHVRILTANMNI